MGDDSTRAPASGRTPRPVPAPGAAPASSVSVVIVNWNGRAELAEMLPSLAGQTFRDFEVIVVDNGSTDGSQDLIESSGLGAGLIQLDRNHGFAEPNNLALAKAAGDFVLTLNNDLVLAPDCVERLHRRLATAPDDVYAVGAKLLYYDRPDTIQTLGIAPLPNGNGVNVAKGEPSEARTSVEDVFGPCAGAAIYRRRVLDEIGFFDDRYFAYLEDVDLAHRARAAGYRAVVDPAAIAFHKHAATSGKAPLRKLYLIERNRLINLRKHYPFRNLAFESVITAAILLRYRFGRRTRTRLSADQARYFRLGSVPAVARVFVAARWWLLRHWNEIEPGRS